MPDNLRVTAPLTTNNKIDKQRAVRENPIPGIASPDKSAPPPIGAENKEALAPELMLNGDSVFGKFIQELIKTPALSETMQELVYAVKDGPGMPQEVVSVNELLRQWFDSIATDKAGMLEDLMFQQKNSSRFSGPLFQFLRNLSARAQDNDLMLRLSGFLKSYDAHFSAPSTMNSIRKSLEFIRLRIPTPYAGRLQEMEAKLPAGSTSEDLKAALKVLNDEILPFFGEYVNKTNDLGASRNRIALLMHSIARLDAGSKEELVEKFEDLLQYMKFRFVLPDDSLNMIKGMFANEVVSERGEVKNSFFDALISLLSSADDSDLSDSKQTHLQDACRSLLLDRSVYMPYVHLFVPIRFEGRFSFSELWIEKKSGENRPPADGTKAPTRIFLLFDLKDLGTFEASIELFDRNVGIELGYPPAFRNRESEITAGVSRIFEQNGLNLRGISLSERPLQIKKRIMKKIVERKYALDVTI